MLEALDQRVAKLNVLDVALVKFSCLFAGIILAKLFPSLLNLNFSILLMLMLGYALMPTYKFWIKK